jgi:hypothetical protein
MLSFFSAHRKPLLLSFMLSALMVLASGAFAQSLDTAQFQTSITDGMQVFFDLLPVFVLLGFTIFAVIFAFRGGLDFARSLLSELISGFTRSGR